MPNASFRDIEKVSATKTSALGARPENEKIDRGRRRAAGGAHATHAEKKT